MAEIPSIGPGSVGPINRAAALGAAYRITKDLQTRSEPLGDRVELSRHAVLLDRMRQLPDVRADLVAEVRDAIADGSYETDDKLTAAVEGLRQDLV